MQVGLQSKLMSTLNEMMRRRVSSVPVVDDRGQLVDIYTKFDVIVSLLVSTAVSSCNWLTDGLLASSLLIIGVNHGEMGDASPQIYGGGWLYYHPPNTDGSVKYQFYIHFQNIYQLGGFVH